MSAMNTPWRWSACPLAIDQARQCGLLGASILGSGFAFEVNISKGAGASVAAKRPLSSVGGGRYR